MIDTAPRPAAVAAPPTCTQVPMGVAPTHPIGARVTITVGGFRDYVGKVWDVRNGLHYLSMDSGISLGGYNYWQLRAVTK